MVTHNEPLRMTDAERTDSRRLENFSFRDSPALADELAALALAGIKAATCCVASGGISTHVGKRMVVLDGSGKPVAIIETVELTQLRFNEVDAAFAHDESEGDRSLQDWRQAHRRYFTRLGQVVEDMLLYCERFRVVRRIDGADERH